MAGFRFSREELEEINRRTIMRLRALDARDGQRGSVATTRNREVLADGSIMVPDASNYSKKFPIKLTYAEMRDAFIRANRRLREEG